MCDQCNNLFSSAQSKVQAVRDRLYKGDRMSADDMRDAAQQLDAALSFYTMQRQIDEDQLAVLTSARPFEC